MSGRPQARNPRDAAREVAAGALEHDDVAVGVLEPSPPAVVNEWMADDPVAPTSPHATVVQPVSGTGITWHTLAEEHPGIAEWCADRWLGAWRPLAEPTIDLIPTRRALQTVAQQVMSPARQSATGRLGLRWTLGGFGTPFFRHGDGPDTQLRVEGANVVVQEGDRVRFAAITTIREVAALCAVPVEDTPEVLDNSLDVRAEAADFLAGWFGFTTAVLEEVRARAPETARVSRVQLWPEHLDPAVELGNPESGGRASFGGSPGDEHHPEPYLYVAPWRKDRPGDYWNDPTFGGASLPLQALLNAPDQRQAALDFLHEGAEHLGVQLRASTA